MVIKKGVVIRIGKKLSGKGSHPSDFQFITCCEVGTGEIFEFAIGMTHPDRSRVHYFVIVEVEAEKSSTKMLTEYDIPLLDECKGAAIKGSKLLLEGRKSVKMVGRKKEEREIRIDLRNVTFYRDHVTDSTSGLVLENKVIGLQDENPYAEKLNDLDIEGAIIVKSTFELFKGKVGNEWKNVWKLKEECDVKVESADLQRFQAVLERLSKDDKWLKFVADVRAKMKQNVFMCRDDLLEMAKNLGIDMSAEDADTMLEHESSKKEYDQRFTEALKQISRGKIYYSMAGFMFEIGQNWVWEEPAPNKATYIFRKLADLPIQQLVRRLETIKRSELREKPVFQAEIGFVRSINHPPLEEGDDGRARWIAKIFED
jgi:post-segregation antitoxin (ccd killing protein)